MKNLKRVLSLALSGIMLVGMMAVGASAVDAKDFTDASEINNKDAVSTMSALGVILGKDTGAFDPEGNVTRAELAKMICVAMNGGKDPVLGTKSTPTYTDIKGHWAESYIEYCSSLGYISGRGNGIFDPAGNVTSTEAAKIILGALGYKADVSGLTGADWAINTNVIANGADVDLYDGLETIDTTAPMNREDAAQMLYNALGAKMVAHNGSNYINSTYSTNVTVREQTGTQRVYVMTVKNPGTNWVNVATAEAALNGMKFASAADADAMADAYSNSGNSAVIGTDYTLKQVEEPVYSISNAAQDFDETFGHKFLSLTTYSDSNESQGYIISVQKEANKDTFTVELDNGMTFRKVKTDYSDLMGQKVKVLYKALDNVYGIYAHTDSAVLYEGVVDDISWTASTSTLKVNGVVYKTDKSYSNTKFYATNYFFDGNGAEQTLGAANALPGCKSANVKVIDNNADGKIDLFVVTPYVAAKVTYKGNDTITLNPAVAGVSSFDLEDDINVYDDIAKGDYVIATPANNTVDGKVSLVKAETVTGKVDAMKSNPYTTARIDGTWYTLCEQQLSGTDSVNVNDEVQLVMKDGYYFFADINVNTTKDLAIAVKVAGTADVNDKWETNLVFTDGTSKTVKAFDDAQASDKPVLGSFYTYEQNKDGVYELTSATTANTGYDGTITGVNMDASTDKLSDGTYIADDAVVIVRHKNTAGISKNDPTKVDGKDSAATAADLATLTKTEILTGKTLKGLSADFGTTTLTKGFTEKVGGLSYAKVIFLAADKQDMVGGTASSYGYIVGTAPYMIKEGSNTYIVFDIWDGEKVVEGVRDQVASGTALGDPYVKGTVIEYSDEGNGIVDNVSASFTSGAIVGYSASDKVMSILTANGTPFAVAETNSDTKYFYINSADKKGVVSDGVELATETSVPGTYYQNVWVKDDGDGKLAAVFIDVNNKLDGKPTVTKPANTMSETGTGVTATTIRNLPDGVYQPTGTGKDSSLAGNFTDVKDLMVFKFTLPKDNAAHNLTLNIKDSTGTVVHSEPGSVTTANDAGNTEGHFFYVWTATNNASAKWNGAVVNEVYSYEILEGTDTIDSGSFIYKAPV